MDDTQSITAEGARLQVQIAVAASLSTVKPTPSTLDGQPDPHAANAQHMTQPPEPPKAQYLPDGCPPQYLPPSGTSVRRKQSWIQRRLAAEGCCFVHGPALDAAAQREVNKLITAEDGGEWKGLLNESGQSTDQSDRVGRRLLPWEQRVKAALADHMRSLGLQAGRLDFMHEGPTLTDGITALRALPGCKEQVDHCDRARVGSLRELPMTQVPLGALWDIQGGTRLVIEGREVTLPANAVLIFRGDMCHAGAAYQALHTRIHAYLDPLNRVRDANLHTCVPVQH